MNRLEKLVRQLEDIQYEQGKLQRERENLPNLYYDTSRLYVTENELAVLAEQEKRISRQIVDLEGCEHIEVEDTGGPDGSQVCMDCGKVR